MNNNQQDSFIQEVDEDLARKRMEAQWKKYGPIIIGAALLIVAITGGYTAWSNYKVNTEQTATVALVEIAEKDFPKPEEQRAALESYAKDYQGKPSAVLAKLQAASLALEADKKAEAIALYDSLAADTSAELFFRQLADLFSVQIQMDDGDPATLEARLAPLMKDDGAWRFMAYELAGYLAIRTGDKEKARTLFAELKDLKDVPPSLASRARDILQWLEEGKQ